MKDQILVAVDPFASNQVNMKNAGVTAMKFAEALQSEMEPAAVLSPDQISWPRDFHGAWVHQLEEQSKKKLKEVGGEAGLPTDNLEVIVQTKHSTKSSAAAIANLASDSKAKAIIAFTHHKQGRRLRIFGSFAMALVSRSKLPLIFINARGNSVTEFKKIFFASDFTPESEVAFRKILKWASTLNAEVIIFHAITPIVPSLSTTVYMPEAYYDMDYFLREEEMRAKVSGQEWIEIAKNDGVDAHLLVRRTTVSIAESILEAGRELNASFFAVCAKTTGWEAAVLGSVTRELLERSTLPVVVLPAGEEELSVQPGQISMNSQPDIANQLSQGASPSSH